MTTTSQARPHDTPTGGQPDKAGLHLLPLLVMMSTSFVLVTAEFLPSGVLSPMATDLRVSPGTAAQTITVTAIVGFLVAPTIGLMAPRVDRRRLLAVLALIAAASSLIVAVAPTMWLVLVGRVLLGGALSGFWAMSLAVAMRLSTPGTLGRAVMIVTMGTSLATVAGVPLGVFVASHIGWRAVFGGIAVVTLVVAAAISVTLPRVPATSAATLSTLGETIRRPGVTPGLIGHVLTVLGHMLAFAFIRLAVERLEGVTPATITLLLALFGVGGLVGGITIGMLVDRHLAVLRFAVPLTTAAAVLGIALLPPSIPGIGALVTVWGGAFGGWLIVVNAWTSRQVPDRPEAGGGLVVAGFQLAITLGAAVGGLLVDGPGVRAAYLVGGALLVIGGIVFGRAGSRSASVL